MNLTTHEKNLRTLIVDCNIRIHTLKGTAHAAKDRMHKRYLVTRICTLYGIRNRLIKYAENLHNRVTAEAMQEWETKFETIES